jgi:hypothetical protein
LQQDILANYFIAYGVVFKLKTDPQLISKRLNNYGTRIFMYIRCLLIFGKHNFKYGTGLINILYESGAQGKLFIIVNVTTSCNTDSVKLQQMAERLFEAKPWSKAIGWAACTLLSVDSQYQ